MEFHLHANLDSKTVKQEFGSYIGLLAYADELMENEQDVWLKFKAWFIEAEKTGMNKSYKMVVLSYMLSKGEEGWLEPITPEGAAPFFHNYLTEKDYRMNIDFSDAQGKRLHIYDQKKIADLIAQMPMAKWSGSANDGIVSFEEGIFKFRLQPSLEENELLYKWTQEIAKYRLHAYFERKAISAKTN